MKTKLMTLAALVLLVSPAAAAVSTWNIDSDHSAAHFRIEHMVIAEVQGSFHKLSGSAQVNGDDLADSSIEVTIAVDSIDTGVEKRDAHLKSADFFEVAKYPTMTFVSKEGKKGWGNKYRVKGDLTLHGVTKEVELLIANPSEPVKDPWGNIRRGAKATTTINRKDFGIVWNATLESGGLLIGEEVEIVIDLELIQQQK